MTKKDYLRAVRSIVAIEKTLRHETDVQDLRCEASIDRVMEVVTAQMALAFAEDSPSFNSFVFSDAVAKARKSLPRR